MPVVPRVWAVLALLAVAIASPRAEADPEYNGGAGCADFVAQERRALWYVP